MWSRSAIRVRYLPRFERLPEALADSVRTGSGHTPCDLGFCADSDVEAELHHVAVLHDVVLALHADLAELLGLEHGAGCHEVVEGDDLRLDEAALEVGVDHARGLGGGGALGDRPGTGLLGAG